MTHAIARDTPFPMIDIAAALAEVTASAEAIIQTLRISRAFLGSGRMVCLDGLDGQVARLCARCLGLDREDGNILRPHLLALRAELDTTVLVMTTREETVPCPSTTS